MPSASESAVKELQEYQDKNNKVSSLQHVFLPRLPVLNMPTALLS